MTKIFTHALSTEWPGSAANEEKFHAEVVASAIAQTLVGINRVGTDIVSEFATDLTAGDETILHGDTSAPAGGLIEVFLQLIDLCV